MVISRRVAVFFLLFGLWTWLLWPNFVRNIWNSERSFADGQPTGYLLVHLALAVVSFAAGNVIAVIGWRGLRASQSRP